MFTAKGVTLPAGGRAKDVVKGGPHPILIPPHHCAGEFDVDKGSALSHDWSIETEIVEVFDGCT